MWSSRSVAANTFAGARLQPVSRVCTVRLAAPKRRDRPANGVEWLFFWKSSATLTSKLSESIKQVLKQPPCRNLRFALWVQILSRGPEIHPNIFSARKYWGPRVWPSASQYKLHRRGPGCGLPLREGHSPSRGAWIEITIFPGASVLPPVASHTGSVDRNGVGGYRLAINNAAPLAGARTRSFLPRGTTPAG